jgi:hypothetical protein
MTILEIAFLTLTAFTVLFLFLIGTRAINYSGVKPMKNKVVLVIGLIAWQFYIFIASSFVGMQSYDFPPRFALAFIIPSFAFTGLFLYRNRNEKWIFGIQEHWLVYFQSFRVLVELLFVYALAEGVFNKEVTIEGFNFDMVFAFTAPIMGLLVYRQKVIPRKSLVFWNYIGLAILASVIMVFMISIYTPHIFGSEVPLLPLEAMTYPFVLIAGFLMPTAVFLHILSLIQLKKQL